MDRRFALLLALTSACGGVAPAPASTPPSASAAPPADDGPSAQELTSARAKVLVAAASAWRRSNATCPTPPQLSDRYAFAPDTDTDAAGRPFVIECDEAETRVVHPKGDGTGKEIVESKPFTPQR
jgi:hypothetical protein